MFPTISVDDSIKAFQALRDWLGKRASGKEKRHRNDQVVMDRILTAVGNTRRYLKRFKNPKQRDPELEKQLADEWMGIASLLSFSTSDEWDRQSLAIMCADKGFYWSDPDAWTEERINSAGIELERVYEQVRKVIAKEGYKPLRQSRDR